MSSDSTSTFSNYLPKAIASAAPAILYDTTTRGTPITAAIPLAIAAGISSAVADLITDSTIAEPLTKTIDRRLLSPVIAGGLFYYASTPLGLYGSSTPAINIGFEGALYSAVGEMLVPVLRSLTAGSSQSGTVNTTSAPAFAQYLKDHGPPQYIFPFQKPQTQKPLTQKLLSQESESVLQNLTNMGYYNPNQLHGTLNNKFSASDRFNSSYYPAQPSQNAMFPQKTQGLNSNLTGIY